MLQRNFKKLFQFSFKSEGLWMLAFSLLPGIIIVIVLLVFKQLGILR